jgi:hypothetical protein
VLLTNEQVEWLTKKQDEFDAANRAELKRRRKKRKKPVEKPHKFGEFKIGGRVTGWFVPSFRADWGRHG